MQLAWLLVLTMLARVPALTLQARLGRSLRRGAPAFASFGEASTSRETSAAPASWNALVDLLCAPTSSLPGVGKTTAAKLEAGLGVETVGQLLMHLPHSVVDRRTLSTASSAEDELVNAAPGSAAAGKGPSMVASLVVTATDYKTPPEYSRAPYKVRAGSGAPVPPQRTSMQLLAEGGRRNRLRGHRCCPPSQVLCVDGDGRRVDLVFFLYGSAAWDKVRFIIIQFFWVFLSFSF